MNRREHAERVAETLLYEGYILYPYRATNAKNRNRWTFGSLFPSSYGGEPSRLQVQCLLRGAPGSRQPPDVRTRVRLLQIVERGDWQEASEREVGPGRFEFAAGEQGSGDDRRCWRALAGEVRSRCDAVGSQAWRFTVTVENCSPLPAGASRQQALPSALASTHVLLEARGGARFVSLIDPPADLREAAGQCRNDGAWPVLIGSEVESDVMLASPIILYDDPQLAPESPGLLYDAGEIDEILNLRVLTLTDAEKREARALDPRSRAIIERSEALTPQQWESLHGTFRDRTSMKAGDRVRLRPRARADIFDLSLDGRIAVIEAIERDYEQRLHVAVALEDDPGRDLGLARMPGHRFFFAPDELEPLQ